MFFMLLIHTSNFVLIRYYLLYNLYDYILCIILNYKNLQIKQIIDDIAIDFIRKKLLLFYIQIIFFKMFLKF